jgi:hypothetical protein
VTALPTAAPATAPADGSPLPRWLAGAPPAPQAWTPHPLGLLALLDRGFSVLRAEFRVLGPVLGAALLPIGVLTAVAARQATGGQGDAFAAGLTTIGGHGAWVLAGVAVTLLWPAIVAGPACRAAAASWYGRRIDIRTAARGLLRVPSLLLAVLCADLLVAVGAVIVLLPAVAVWVALHLTLAVMVVDGRNVFWSLRRSARLVGRRAGWALLLVVCTGLIGVVLEALLSLLPDLLTAALGPSVGLVVVAVGFTAVRVVTWTWALIVQALFALDVQARTEGLDLVVRAGRAGR